MMRKEILVPAVAVAGGAAGFFLRRWELSTAFEGELGLPISGAPATLALAALSAAVAVAVLLLCRGKHSAFPGGYDQAFQAKGNTVYVVAMVLSAFLMLGVGILLTVGLPEAYVELLSASRRGVSPLLPLLPRVGLALLCLLCCPGLLSIGRNNYRGEGHGKYSFALLAPAYVGCMWLIVAYQQRAADPVQLDYVYQLFAIVSILLGLYYSAGFSFERAKVVRTAFFSAMSVYFSMVTLADGHTLAETLLYLALGLCLAANLSVLLANDVRYRDAKPEPETKEERMPEDMDGLTQTEIELEFGSALQGGEDTEEGEDHHE